MAVVWDFCFWHFKGVRMDSHGSCGLSCSLGGSLGTNLWKCSLFRRYHLRGYLNVDDGDSLW